MSVSEPAGAPTESPGTLGANIRVGARLLASAVVFVFVAFVFAFFYLKALNSNGDFKPKHTNLLQGYGIIVLVCVLGAAGVFDTFRRRLAAGTEQGWRAGAFLSLTLGFAAFVVQIFEYTAVHFKTAAGGYASVFFGWTLVFLLFWLGALYWIETLAVQQPGSEQAGSEDMRAAAEGCAVYLYTLAGIELVSYILLYLIK